MQESLLGRQPAPDDPQHGGYAEWEVFIEGDTEADVGSCQAILIAPKWPRGSCTPPEPRTWTAGTQGVLPSLGRVCSGEGWETHATPLKPQTCLLTCLPNGLSIHSPVYPGQGAQPSLAALQPGPMVLLLRQQGNEGIAV